MLMKRRILALSALLLALLLLCSCGGGKFSIEGKWKNVGSTTFGQVQKDAVVIFNGTNCNFFSPRDTYAFYKEGSRYKLDCTSFLFSETLTFNVKVVNKDNIEVDTGSDVLKLKRVD